MKPGRNDPYKDPELMINVLNSMRRLVLDKKPHIKEYYKIRNLHSEIVDAMVQYYQDGKFKQKADKNSVSKPTPIVTVHLLECSFDLTTREGAQGFYDMLIYKPAPNISCITEDFIRDHHYKNPKKQSFCKVCWIQNWAYLRLPGQI
jgi:hypothetical protein